MRLRKDISLLWFFMFLLFASCSISTAPSSVVRFSTIQTNIFDKSCAISGCHAGTQPAALLDLEAGKSYASLLEYRIENDTGRKYFKSRVAQYQPDASFLFAKVSGSLTPDEGFQMPQTLRPLSQNEIDAIREWISEGAYNN